MKGYMCVGVVSGWVWIVCMWGGLEDGCRPPCHILPTPWCTAPIVGNSAAAGSWVTHDHSRQSPQQCTPLAESQGLHMLAQSQPTLLAYAFAPDQAGSMPAHGARSITGGNCAPSVQVGSVQCVAFCWSAGCPH